jgi:hypothetical protein
MAAVQPEPWLRALITTTTMDKVTVHFEANSQFIIAG